MGYESLEQPLTLIQSACTHLSLELGTDIYLGINCAAHELMDYVSFISNFFNNLSLAFPLWGECVMIVDVMA